MERATYVAHSIAQGKRILSTRTSQCQ